MKRFLKWFFGILVTLIILLVIAAITLPYYFDPNKYKDQIIANIQPHMMGRDLKIPGKIKISIFPWLGVDIGKTVIGNADGFVLKPFMTIKHLRAHIRLLSLLSDTPEIGSLEFDGVELNLQRDAEGRNNWSDLMKQAGAPRKARPHKTALTHKPATAIAIPRLKVDGIHFKDTTIHFDDNLNKNHLTISKLNLDAGPINQFQPIPLRGRLNYDSKNQGLAAASAFATTLHITPAGKKLSLQQLAINTNVTGKALNNKTVTTALTVPDLQVDLGQERVEVRAFHLTLDKMQSDGHLRLHQFSHPVVRFGLDMDTLDLDRLLPAHSKAVAPVPSTTGTAVDTSPAIFAALLPLKTADMQGTFNVKKLVFNHLQFDKASVTVIARSGLISAEPQASLYQGTYQGDVQINVAQKPVHVRLHQQLKHVAMGPITKALTGKESLTGFANIQGQFFSQGNTLEQITQQLNGDASFTTRDVQLTLMDVEQLVLQDWYDKLKLAQKQQQGKRVTAFDSVRGSIRVENGIAYNHDFSAVAQRVHLTGSGQANLVQRTVDYTLVTIPQTSLAISVKGKRYDLKGKHIPTHIHGPWASPQINNDLQSVIKADLNTAVQTKKQEIKQDVQKKVQNKVEQQKDKLRDKLKSLLHR